MAQTKPAPKPAYELALTAITLEINGVHQTKPLQEWCYHFGIPYVNARMRYTRGKRGMDIFKTSSTKNLELHLRQRYNHAEVNPVRKYSASVLLAFLPEQTRERFAHHVQRLGMPEDKLLTDMVEYVLKRLDAQEAKQATPNPD